MPREMTHLRDAAAARAGPPGTTSPARATCWQRFLAHFDGWLAAGGELPALELPAWRPMRCAC